MSSGLSVQTVPYKDAALTPEERTLDLLRRMTLEEKVGQLLCPLGWEMYAGRGKDVRCSDAYKEQIDERRAGMFWATFRADPWTKKTIENGLDPESAAKAANELQRYAVEETRLGIPVFLAEEAAHGHMAIGTTVFPTGIGQAATFNPELIERMGRVIGEELRLQGAHIGYGPVLDLAREPRWSRVEETYGEDPVLSAVMGSALVRGMGGGDLSRPEAVISTLKHFVAYGVPEGGHNGNPSVVGARDLQENFFLPFRAAVEAGALSVMTAYNSMDGVPCTMNAHLLRDVLRDEWGFRGFTVSDLYSIDGIWESHRVARTLDEAGAKALEAGLDVDLGSKAYATLVAAVREGRIEEAWVDSAAARVLRLKFEMGLFDHPYVEPRLAKERVRSAEHVAVAREVARQSIVLLENRDGLLPLDKKKINRIAVIGPNADNQYNMLGDYTAPQEADNVATVYEALCEALGAERVVYAKGCAVRDVDEADIGCVQEGQRVDFTVDAYPDDIFQGLVKQVRLEATTESSVVTYEVVITAYNPDLKLKPGLTANVTIYTMERDNVCCVPSKALRFVPDGGLLKALGYNLGVDDQTWGAAADGTVCWVVSGDQLVPRKIITGQSDGEKTEVVSGLRDGETVAVGLQMAPVMPDRFPQQERSPFMPGPPR